MHLKQTKRFQQDGKKSYFIKEERYLYSLGERNDIDIIQELIYDTYLVRSHKHATQQVYVQICTLSEGRKRKKN